MKSSDKKTNKPLKSVADDFLIDLLKASSPSGYESEAQAVVEKYVAQVAEIFSKDVLGNRIATIHSQGCPRVLMTGHMDEIGFIVRHVNKEGFLFFDAIGGHDVGLISGRKVKILTSKGVVYGVTGRRAIHLLDAEERKKLPKLQAIWIDIGAKSREEALKKIAIGDPIVYEQEPFYVLNGCMCGRGIDDRGGTYVVQEVLRRLAKDRHLEASLTSVSTTQEEIGIRGAMPVTYAIHPDVGIAVDVGHATDFPDGDSNRLGDFKLGAGPILARGPNISPIVFVRLKECAERLKIPYQVEAESGPTGTDARVIQMSRNGVATGLVSIPLRYMHTPNEMVRLDDIEWTIQLLVEFTRSLKASDKFEW
jgi:endoglucanase